MNITGSFARLSVLLCVGLAGGCILTTSEDTATDAGSDGAETLSAGSDGASTGDSGNTGVDVTGDETDSADEGTTGPSGDCSANLVLDPSFEDGTPSTEWSEASDTFGTPICDASCTEDVGAGPHDGDWWAWFGGVDTADTASVSQDVTIAAADNAYLIFRFSVNASAGAGDDTFRVLIDGTEVFMATDAEIDDYADYTYVDLDATAYADGAAHNVRFESDLAGTGITSFFLDQIELVTCNEGGTGSSESGSDSGTTAADTTGGSSDSGSSGDSGSSESGGSSGSSTGM